jgi:hypothetical protein
MAFGQLEKVSKDRDKVKILSFNRLTTSDMFAIFQPAPLL